ncbi:methyltransferase domain-containing protein [Cordyceps javanica]|nr:methyltransferase domain-containing protein [Cordyceps javanica]
MPSPCTRPYCKSNSSPSPVSKTAAGDTTDTMATGSTISPSMLYKELNRLDMLNKFFFLARDKQAFSYPLRRGGQTRVLDLGTGTGIWAIHVAEE